MKKYLFFTLLLLLATATQAQNQPKQRAGQLSLIVRYLNAADSTQVAESVKIDTMSAGQKYAIPSPIVAGYHPDRDTVKGRMPETDWVETVLYTKDTFRVSLKADPEECGTVSGEGEYEYQTEVIVTAVPNEGYAFVNWTEYDDEVSTEASDTIVVTWDVEWVAHFTLLPPVVGTVVAPHGICSGESLELTTPEVTNADEQGWEMAPDGQFANVVAYTGQELDASYNGWQLRYYAANNAGIVYSNVVGIVVNTLEPELTGDAVLCSMLTGTYTALNVGGADLTWTVSDPAATVTEANKIITVVWTTAGEQTVTLLAENSETGCSATVTMAVTVQSFVNESDINDIVAKNNGNDYILIYPNPKDTYKYQWYKDGQPINGAKGQYYHQENGLDSGVYKVYISFNADADGNLFCGAFTKEYIVAEPVTLGLCPNPAHVNEGIVVMNGNGGELSIDIYSLDGRLLHQQTVSGTQVALNVNLPKGLYLVKLTDQDMVETTQKLIIE